MRTQDKVNALSAFTYNILELKIERIGGLDFGYEFLLKVNNNSNERVSFKWLNIDLFYEEIKIAKAYVSDPVAIPANDSYNIRVRGKARATDFAKVLLRVAASGGKFKPIKFLGTVGIGLYRIPVDYLYEFNT
jgi:hypothetical protein